MTTIPSAQLSSLRPSVWGEGGRTVLADIQEVVLFSLPMNIRFRGITVREGLLLRGHQGWGECAPFWNYDPKVSSSWLLSAIRQATEAPPAPLRDKIPVNVTIPVCGVEEALRRLRSQPGCNTAKVKVADPGFLTEEDVGRVEAVANYLGNVYGDKARIRIDANTAWGVDEAADALDRLNHAARSIEGLEYAEQPVKTALELSKLRKLTSVPLAADESIRLSSDPLAVRRLDAADVAVLKAAPLGGVASALGLAERMGLPAVVSSALDSSIGISAGVSLAAVLPSLDYACGLNTVTMFAQDVVQEPLVAEDGEIDVARARAVARGELTRSSRLVEPDTVSRWEDRLRLMVAELSSEVA